MAMLKLFQVSAPSTATQVTATKTPVRQAILASSNSTTYSFGDSTMTTAATGVVVAASAQPVYIGNHNPAMGFDLSELYVIAASGNVNIVCLLF